MLSLARCPAWMYVLRSNCPWREPHLSPPICHISPHQLTRFVSIFYNIIATGLGQNGNHNPKLYSVGCLQAWLASSASTSFQCFYVQVPVNNDCYSSTMVTCIPRAKGIEKGRKQVEGIKKSMDLDEIVNPSTAKTYCLLILSFHSRSCSDCLYAWA